MKSSGIVASIVSLLVLGCGGASSEVGRTTGGPLHEEEPPAPAGPVQARGSGEVRARVGPAGGTLALSNGARLEIPAGALRDPIEIVFQVGADGRAFLHDRDTQRPLGPTLAISPAVEASEGHTFVLSIPEQPLPQGWRPEDLALAMESADAQGRAIDTLATQTRWESYPIEVRGGRFVARIASFPGHRLRFGVAR